MESAVWGIIGALVGAFASIATTYIQTRNAGYLQEADVKRQREERLREFQRNTLIELQDVLHDLWRMATRIYLEDEAAFKNSGNWGANRLSDEVNEGYRVLGRRATILLERVSDNQLRAEVKDVMGRLSNMTLSRSKADADRTQFAMADEGPAVMERIGIVLRSQY